MSLLKTVGEKIPPSQRSSVENRFSKLALLKATFAENLDIVLKFWIKRFKNIIKKSLGVQLGSTNHWPLPASDGEASYAGEAVLLCPERGEPADLVLQVVGHAADARPWPRGPLEGARHPDVGEHGRQPLPQVCHKDFYNE